MEIWTWIPLKKDLASMGSHSYMAAVGRRAEQQLPKLENAYKLYSFSKSPSRFSDIQPNTVFYIICFAL
jgi:hypothetical protein